MNKPWIILDCNNLAYRGYYSMGRMSGNEPGLWTAFGFFYQLLWFQNEYNTKKIIFCWDHGKNKRRKLMKEYKANRRAKRRKQQEELGDDVVPAWKEIRKQCKIIRKIYLPMMGYKNILFQKGYEADDMIARSCEAITSRNERGIIVSSDQDMYQCITAFISWFSPPGRKKMDLQKFRRLYKMPPKKWAMVKAIAGCTSDNVKGIPGIGEIRATQHVNGGGMNKMSEGYKKLNSKEAQAIIKRNIPIVTLPFKGTKEVILKNDKVTKKGWEEVGNIMKIPLLQSLRFVSENPQHKILI